MTTGTEVSIFLITPSIIWGGGEPALGVEPFNVSMFLLDLEILKTTSTNVVGQIHELDSQLKMFDIGQTNDEFEAITAFSLLISEGGNVKDEQSCIRDPRRVA